METVINADCLDVLQTYDCIFADPPDNIGLKYSEYKDNIPEDEYVELIHKWVMAFCEAAPIVWISFNAKWIVEFAKAVDKVTTHELKPCVQTFTFGNYKATDLTNDHRPLWRLKRPEALIYPDQIKVPSWRELNGDKRAKAGGRVPSDVFDFPRVTGNSKQRRAWHKTQLNEDLVERAVLLSTQEGDHVCDPFGGTGTTLRVCKKISRKCTLIEIDKGYCEKIRDEHRLV